MKNSSNKLDGRWFIGKSGKEKEEFEIAVRNSSSILGVIFNEILKMEDEVLGAECKEAQYDSDWVFLQAHRNGKKEVLRNLKSLFKHIE